MPPRNHSRRPNAPLTFDALITLIDESRIGVLRTNLNDTQDTFMYNESTTGLMRTLVEQNLAAYLTSSNNILDYKARKDTKNFDLLAAAISLAEQGNRFR